MSDDAHSDHGAVRIPANPGGANPPTDITITFDGIPLPARSGEPVIAALFAAGVRVLRTMPRIGEARGGFCMVGRCSDCMMVINGVPNVRACVTPAQAGMTIQTQRGLGEWPGGDA